MVVQQWAFSTLFPEGIVESIHAPLVQHFHPSGDSFNFCADGSSAMELVREGTR